MQKSDWLRKSENARFPVPNIPIRNDSDPNKSAGRRRARAIRIPRHDNAGGGLTAGLPDRRSRARAAPQDPTENRSY